MYARVFIVDEIRGEFVLHVRMELVNKFQAPPTQLAIIVMPAGTLLDQRGPRVYTEGDGGAAEYRERYRTPTRQNVVHNVSHHIMINCLCLTSVACYCREYPVTECHQSYKK